MYRCEVCQEVSKPGEPQHRHAVMRAVRFDATANRFERREIDRELSVCTACNDALTVLRVPLSTLLTQRGKPRPVRVQTVHVPYLETVPVVPPRTQRRVTFGSRFTETMLNVAKETAPIPGISPHVVCDVCGKDATDGQSTADSVLCLDCVRKAQR